jgi:hypothetical protein
MDRIDMDDVIRLAQQLEGIARPLDWAVWQAWCGQVTQDDVVAHLATYQNADGGFGHGIEPDVWHPASSPLATTVALQYAHQIGLPSQYALVQRALGYLAGAYDRVAGKWHPMAVGVNEYPHAPWWQADAQTGLNALDRDWPNPTAEIIGYLSAYQGVHADLSVWYNDLTTHIAQADTMESHALACYVRAYGWLPNDVQSVIYPHVVRLLRPTIHPVPAEWQSAYVPTPLDYVHTPASPFFAEIADLIDIQLDQWCYHVQTVGVWHPTWEWGQYDNEWATAHGWWTGKMTVERIMIMHQFGRIV